MTPAEAGAVLGETEDRIRQYQAKGWMPDPIPDDFLDAFIAFRLRMESVHARRTRLEAASVPVEGDGDVEG